MDISFRGHCPFADAVHRPSFGSTASPTPTGTIPTPTACRPSSRPRSPSACPVFRPTALCSVQRWHTEIKETMGIYQQDRYSRHSSTRGRESNQGRPRAGKWEEKDVDIQKDRELAFVGCVRTCCPPVINDSPYNTQRSQTAIYAPTYLKFPAERYIFTNKYPSPFAVSSHHCFPSSGPSNAVRRAHCRKARGTLGRHA